MKDRRVIVEGEVNMTDWWKYTATAAVSVVITFMSMWMARAHAYVTRDEARAEAQTEILKAITQPSVVTNSLDKNTKAVEELTKQLTVLTIKYNELSVKLDFLHKAKDRQNE